jgi:branched-chain amino acid transport system substrate-binding protein
VKITRRHALGGAAAAAALLSTGRALAQSGQTVRIAFIDPLSGPFANVGQNQLKSWQFMADHFSKRNVAGVKFEMVPFDNKNSPQDSLTALRAIADQGIRYITQGNGSHVAIPLSEAVTRHNERNPGKEIVYLNYAAVDPDLTNSRCSYWHFRLDADTSMKMEALTSYMKDQPDVRNVYLINQNYSHGQQVARFFKETMARKKPEVKIVGEDLHPLGQVKDFAPFVAKIKASGADSIVTGNWGQDLTLLIKAANDAGLRAAFYTYYAPVSGTPTALAGGTAGAVRVVGILDNQMASVRQLQNEFKQRFNDDWYTGQTFNGLALMAQAIANAKSADPVRVAAAMSGLKVQGFNGEIEMRRADHQLQQPMVISEWRRATSQIPYSVENTGFNFQTIKAIPAFVASTPTSCQMKRP